MRLSNWGKRRDTGDKGVALVAAVAVAIIGIGISVVVVTQAISVTQGTARDRIRTLEVHSAEGALDTTMSLLATEAPCPGPSWSPATSGSGATATTVTVTIKYWDAGGNLLVCNAGVLSGVAKTAVVRTTSAPASDGPGIEPERTFEATVKLVPQSESIPGASLFAATSISTGAGFILLPSDASVPAGVWVDSGNYTCNTNVQITGSLYVVNGSATMNNGCTVSGDAWVRNGYTNCCTVPATVWQVGGDLTIRNGNLTLSNRTRIGGDVKVSGTVPLAAWAGNPWSVSTIGGSACASNLPTQCSSFVDYSPVGLPHVDFDMADWQPNEAGVNFQLKHKADFASAMLKSWGLDTLPASDWRVQQIVNNPCYIPGYISTVKIQLPYPGTTTPTVFDMRDCTFQPNGSVTLALYGDIAIFANSFQGSNGLNVISGDGQPHKMWMIVPWGSGTNGQGSKTITVKTTNLTYTPGKIQYDTGINVNKLISVFVYTPKALNFPNTSETYGQLYGGTITVGQGSGKFYYSAIGVPGVDLSIPTSTAAGFEVEIVSKRELHD